MNEQSTNSEMNAPETPQVGMGSRFLAVFTDPRKAFASIRGNHEWLAYMVIVFILAIAGYQLTKPLIIRDQLAQLEQRLDANPSITAEQKEAYMEQTESMMSGPLAMVFAVVAICIMAFAGAGILLFLGNIIMGGQTSYLHVLNMFTLTWMIGIPESIIKIPLALAKDSAKVATSLALLLPADSPNAFLMTLLGKFDLFGLWQLILVIIGMSVLCKTSTAKSAWTVGIAWLVWVLIQSGLAVLGINLGG